MDHITRKERTKASIEAAAIDCFSHRGFNGVTMEEIAAKAELTKRTVYNHYPTKGALIASIFERRLEELYQLEQSALERCTTAREVIYTQFRVLSQFTKANYGFMQMFWSLKDNINNGDVPEDVLSHIVSLNRKLIDMPASHIASKELTGLLAAYTPEMIIHYISAINKGLFLQYDKENRLSLKGPTQDDLTAFALDCLLYCL